jgi:Spy/CpxP family protein refolding chaperone
MFRTDLIAAAAAALIAAATPVAALTVDASEINVVAPAETGLAPQQQLSGEFWNGARWNGVLSDETALSDEAIDAFLAAIDPVKAAA